MDSLTNKREKANSTTIYIHAHIRPRTRFSSSFHKAGHSLCHSRDKIKFCYIRRIVIKSRLTIPGQL